MSLSLLPRAPATSAKWTAPRRARAEIGEHHLAPAAIGGFWRRVPAAEVFLAYLAARTSRITVGAGFKILATNSARRSADEMCTLDLLAPGRIEFGLGMGPILPGLPESRAEKASRFRVLPTAILE